VQLLAVGAGYLLGGRVYVCNFGVEVVAQGTVEDALVLWLLEVSRVRSEVGGLPIVGDSDRGSRPCGDRSSW
jgi:hypothetical protein